MSLVKRISTTLFSRIDQVVSEIENHDALIQAAITEQKKKLAAAKVQLSKIHASEKRTKEQLAESRAAAIKWESRALKEAADNEEKALLCLQRKQQIGQQQAKLMEMISEYHLTASKLERDIQHCENELKSMIQKHELMRARQCSVDAMAVINHADTSNMDQLQTSFDRWEIRLSQGEMFSTDISNMDLLEQEYLEEESADALKLELAELLRQQSSGNHA